MFATTSAVAPDSSSTLKDRHDMSLAHLLEDDAPPAVPATTAAYPTLRRSLCNGNVSPPLTLPAGTSFGDALRKTTSTPSFLPTGSLGDDEIQVPLALPTGLKMASSSGVQSRKKGNLKVTTETDSKRYNRKRIEKITDAELAERYIIGMNVMPSTNTGMDVLHAMRISDGEEVVIKRRMRHNSFRTDSEEPDWRTTTEYQLNMPKVETLCTFYEALETPEAYYVVMEKVMGKDLFEVMANERVSIEDAKEVVRQILLALSHMHGSGRIHKDLKIENVMVDFEERTRSPNTCGPARCQNGHTSPMSPGSSVGSPISPVKAKLIDFDTVQDWEPASPKVKDVLGTDGYIAPEAYDGNYSPASDIYAVGVIMYKLLTRKYPFRSDIFDDQPGENYVGSPAMKRIQSRLKKESALIDFSRKPFDTDPMAVSLCAAMLSYNPMKRPSADQALATSWFSQ